MKKCALRQLTKGCSIIIICVKPQDIDELLKCLSLDITRQHLVICIAAGVTTRHIEKSFGVKVPVVRVMPNMPGLIGKGISAYCLGRFANQASDRKTRLIFSAIGRTIKIREDKMNAVTAVSGSGPGFIAYLTQCLINSAEKIGLSKESAEFLCLYTLMGTAHLLTKSGLKPKDLAKRVASRGGTTEAGLGVLRKKGTARIVYEAISAAAKRASELSKK